MAYVLWEISRHEGAPHLHFREDSSTITWPKSQGFLPPSSETLDQLLCLNAVIRESLRLRNTAPTSNPCSMPENETTKVGTCDEIPGGVRIGGFAWCLHRQEDVFEHSEEWNPDRWLSDDKQKLAEMNKWDRTFGSGSRMCLGKNLAWQCK
jgi:cytochrome P450